MRDTGITKEEFYGKYISKCFSSPKHEIYSSWIPTNLGSIQFEYIVNELSLHHKWQSSSKNTHSNEVEFIDMKPQISDQMSLDLFSLFGNMPGQSKPMVYVSLKYNETHQSYEGEVFVCYLSDSSYETFLREVRTCNHNLLKTYNSALPVNEEQILQEHTNHLRKLKDMIKWDEKKRDEIVYAYISGQFNFKTNGLVDLTHIGAQAITFKSHMYNLSNNKAEELLYNNLNINMVDDNIFKRTAEEGMEDLPLLLYTIVKRTVHSDTHHHSKIDTIIPVVAKENFRKEDILNSMAYRVKEIESTMKRLNREPEKEYASYADGIYSYMKSFANIVYENAKEKEESVKSVEPVLLSINALNRRIKPYQSCKERFFSIFKITTLASISLSILLTGVTTLGLSHPSGVLKVIANTVLKYPHLVYGLVVFLLWIGYPALVTLFSDGCRKYFKSKFGFERSEVIKNRQHRYYRITNIIFMFLLLLLMYFIGDILSFVLDIVFLEEKLNN